MSRILLATLGSLGDLHPMLALGLELQRRGHAVTVATLLHYRERVGRLGLGFHAMRPDWDPTDGAMIARCEDQRTGHVVLIRELVLPYLRGMYDDLLAAATGPDGPADWMIAGELVYAAPLVAEKLGLRWASAILSPESFLSAHDPSFLANQPEAYLFRRAGWVVNRAILEIGKWSIYPWWKPVRQLRRELGLRVACDPVFKDKFSPELVLALFSRCLAEPQLDWPRNTMQPGFVFFDGAGGDLPELDAFLKEGDAPIVFTLGSTAVHHPGGFYEASVEAAGRLERRAVLVGVGPEAAAPREGVLALRYAPYSRVFPMAAAIVHQGGSGTTGQALRAGKPQLIVPFGWDQPDNGMRIERMGAGLCLARKDYSAERAADSLRKLLRDDSIRNCAVRIGEKVGAERGIAHACDAVESMLRSGPKSRFN